MVSGCGCGGSTEALDERAAIREHDGGLTREQAEAAARREFAGRCAGCGQPVRETG